MIPSSSSPSSGTYATPTDAIRNATHATQRTDSDHDIRPTEAQRRASRKIEHVLVCLDGSMRSEVALSHAILLASTFDARVTLLHVMQQRAASGSPTDAFAWEFARQRAHGYLESMRARLAASGVDAESLVAEGCAATRIAAVASELAADLIVLSSHGEGGSVDFDMGSTAQQVLAVARGSVLVARSSVNTRPSSIVVPLDGSARTECVIPTAVRLAKQNGASLTLVHVVSEPVRSSILSSDDLDLARNLARRLEAGAHVYLAHVKQQISHEVHGIRTEVLRDENPQQAILDFAEREGADLVVVAAHGTTCNASLACGSTTAFLLAHARPALLMIQDVADDATSRHHGVRATGTAPRKRQSYRVVAA